MKIKPAKAFTLIELMVAMLISSVVIGIAMGIYVNLQKYALKSTEKDHFYKELLFFESSFRRDIENCCTIQAKSQELFIQNSSQLIIYDFSQEYILREWPDKIDTFHIPVTGFDLEYLDSEQAYINEIQLEFSFGGDAIPYYISKTYSRDLLHAIDIINQ
jgi:prepilin-type N-terminal cleavage/methylation domain-containing protein